MGLPCQDATLKTTPSLFQVSSQLEGRLRRLGDMKSDLDNFTDNMDNLDAWLDDTSHELSDIRRSAATSDDTEALLEAFKVRRHLYGYLGDTGDPFTWGGQW